MSKSADEDENPDKLAGMPHGSCISLLLTVKTTRRSPFLVARSKPFSLFFITEDLDFCCLSDKSTYTS